MHSGASRANRLRAPVSVRTAVFYGATLDSRSTAALAHRRPAMLAGPLFAVLARPLYATLAGGRPFCAIVVRRLAAAIVTMVDPVANAGVADTLEARLADARKRHADGEYGAIPLLIVELGIRSQWATEHPSRPVSPRPVQNKGGVVNEVDGGARVNGNNGTNQRGVIKVDGGVDRSQARVQQSTAAAGSSHADVNGQRRSPLRRGGGLSVMTHVAGLKGFADDVGLRGEFRATHLLTFMVISRRCSPVAQLALRSCRERLDAGHQAWHFILSTYKVRDDLYIGQLEEKMTHIRMGEQESATDYRNRALRILAEMRMAGAEYSTASYISHIIKGLPRGYNLMKRMMMVPGTRESLDEDSITSYILQDEAMQEAEQPTELLPQANYAAPMKLNQQQGQRTNPGGGGSGSGRSTKDVDGKRSTRDKGCGGGGRRRECWIYHDPDHLSYECPDCDDSYEDDIKGGRSQSTSRRPRRDAKPHKEKQTLKKTLSTKDVDNSSSKSRGDGEASCSMVGVVTVALRGEAGKRVLIPDVLYVPSVQANLLSADQLKESGVQMQGDGDKMLLVAATGEVLGRARYNGRVLWTDLRPCSTLAHVGVDMIKSSAKQDVATGLSIIQSTGADPPCVSCVGGKLAQHTFSDKGSDAEEALAVVHIDLCGPFWVAAKDGSLFFLLLKDRHTRFVWVMPVAKKSDVLREFQK
ncbi:unnamed protein product [Closterium sp. NIES-53]